DARLVVHPSLGLVRLAHDAHRVWSATMFVDAETRAAALAALSPRAGRFRLAVARADDGVAIIELDGAEDAFLAALVAGADFETALERAPGLDATAAIARILDEARLAAPTEGNRT
ncbi:MAG: hypothetical protein KGQ28_10150, partial [Hyphomicrobiales bacterium]|nr:hypothetical protein [Hyphomicrobiales bacterium]